MGACESDHTTLGHPVCVVSVQGKYSNYTTPIICVHRSLFVKCMAKYYVIYTHSSHTDILYCDIAIKYAAKSTTQLLDNNI